MSDLNEEPTDDEITYPDAREDQADFQALVDENDGDFQEAVDEHQSGEEPEDPRRNASMP